MSPVNVVGLVVCGFAVLSVIAGCVAGWRLK